MTELRITDGFREDLLSVESDRVLGHILDVVDLLQTIPTMGSRDLPVLIRSMFGEETRKVPVEPFDIATMYDEAHDAVIVAGLIHQHLAW